MRHIIKPGINIDFYGRRRTFFAISGTLLGISLLALVINVFVRGRPVNFGTDFEGGSQVEVEFQRDVPVGDVRSALNRGGFKGAEVVRVNDDHGRFLFMLRLSEVTSLSTADRDAVEKKLEGTFAGKLKRFDYKTGSDKIYVKLDRSVELDAKDRGAALAEKIRSAFHGTGVGVQQVRLFGRPQDRAFEVTLEGLAGQLRQTFQNRLGKGAVKDIPSVETVGAKAGHRLRDDGIRSLLYTLLLILVYLALRFDFRYAPGAVIALLHDVVATVGLYAVTWSEFSLVSVAALLTIAGYSVNDTVVVFDRIRENMARLRDRKFSLVVNASINETLSRTILTSLTVFLTSAAIWIFGTGLIQNFAMALTFGVVVGTYSSIFIASPIVVGLNDRYVEFKRRASVRQKQS